VRRRHRARGLAVGLVVTGAVLLAGPGAASASFDFSQIDLKATNGYSVRIVGNNQPYPFGAGNFVGLSTHKNHAYASYDTGGVSTAKHLQADLSPYGTIDVNFHPQKTTHPPLNGPHCTGDYKQIKGVWKGTIDFEGENGYTKLHVTSADGKHVVNSEKCQGGHTKHGYVELSAQTAGATFTTDLRKKDGATPEFSFFSSQFLGSMSIFRTADVHGTKSMFSFASNYSHAKVTPPAPFTGNGSFTSPSLWTGSLQVDLPGAPNTVIAGPGWAATLGDIRQKR
jgi:hypothetical protein